MVYHGLMKRNIGDEVIVMTRLQGKITDVLDGAYKVSTPVGELTLSEKYVYGVREVQLPRGVDEYKDGKYRARYRGKFLGFFEKPEDAELEYLKAKGEK